MVTPYHEGVTLAPMGAVLRIVPIQTPWAKGFRKAILAVVSILKCWHVITCHAEESFCTHLCEHFLVFIASDHRCHFLSCFYLWLYLSIGVWHSEIRNAYKTDILKSFFIFFSVSSVTCFCPNCLSSRHADVYKIVTLLYKKIGQMLHMCAHYYKTDIRYKTRTVH